MLEMTLFELVEGHGRGRLLVAENEFGKLVHIDEVPSGLACACFCLGCGRPLVAKKGKELKHHFAHHSEQNGDQCSSAGETALHKYAKFLLGKELVLALPEHIVTLGSDKETVVPKGQFKFDKATLEKRAGEIVPDVVLWLRDRRLIVEFKVTHSCDVEKIEKITALGIGAIEIDLEEFRDRKLNELKDAILVEAPRKWLYNPHEKLAAARLNDRANARQVKLAADASKLLEVYHASPSLKSRTIVEIEKDARSDGLGEFVNLNVDGSNCFSVGAAEWQASILMLVANEEERPVSMLEAYKHVRNWRLIKAQLEKLDNEIVSELKKQFPGFASPWEAIESYFEALFANGCIHKTKNGDWILSRQVRETVATAREERDRPIRRLNELRLAVDEILSGMPEHELGNYDFEEWIVRQVPKNPCSMKEAALLPDSAWQAVLNQVKSLNSAIRFSAHEGMNLMGLPLETKLRKRLDEIATAKRAREEAKRQKAIEEAENRLTEIQREATHALGPQAEAWLNTPNANLNNTKPIDESAGSRDGFQKALRELDRQFHLVKQAARENDLANEFCAKLRKECSERYSRPEAVDLWMRSSRQELGGKSPATYCRDKKTFERCRSLLPPKGTKR